MQILCRPLAIMHCSPAHISCSSESFRVAWLPHWHAVLSVVSAWFTYNWRISYSGVKYLLLLAVFLWNFNRIWKFDSRFGFQAKGILWRQWPTLFWFLMCNFITHFTGARLRCEQVSFKWLNITLQNASLLVNNKNRLPADSSSISAQKPPTCLAPFFFFCENASYHLSLNTVIINV